MVDRTNADAVAELARKGTVEPHILKTESGRELLVLPSEDGGARHVDVSEPGVQLAPEANWTVQAVTVQTADSLVDYMNRFKVKTSSLFADIDSNRIVAVIDYHDIEPGARLGHRATLDLPYSVEWLVWSAIDGELMDQLTFARFIEENAGDFSAPTAADLLEVTRELQAHRKVNFIKAVRTASDNENFEFSDQTDLGTKRGDLEVPTKFTLRLPIYFGGPLYTIEAFLRWSLIEGAGLKLGISIRNREHVRQAVFKEVVMDVADRSELPAYFGRI